MNIYRERITIIQDIMRRKGVDYYLIPLSDYHNSEYFDDYYNAIKFVCGFSGSNATALISKDSAYLWTDGRYFIQAEHELEGSGIILMKQGLKDVPSVEKFLAGKMTSDEVLAFDGRMVNVSSYEKYDKALKGQRDDDTMQSRGGARIYDADLISDIWEDRKRAKRGNIWILPKEYAGEDVRSKLSRIRENNNFKKADALIVSDLCDIAWTLNLRGGDIEHMPVFYSYLIITNREAVLYLDEDCLCDDIVSYLADNGITICNYDSIYDDVVSKEFLGKYGIYKTLIDTDSCNTALFTALNEHTKVLKSRSVVGNLKCIKNETEIKNIRNAHVKDGVAVTKFLYFIDKTLLLGEKKYSEIELADMLHTLRSEQEGFLDDSFDTISAWAEHGAIVHYEADERSNATIGRDNFLLVDSGGHYMDGTTDITRTILIGDATDKMRRDYTLVLKSNIALARAIFYDGTGGKSLDMLPRNVMWQHGYDYLHGTGHGVGYLLSVHEGPNNISIRGRKDVLIKPGMVTTDEPGLYLEGEYGIRLENELLCNSLGTDEYGERYNFECLTLVPFQLDCIETSMLTDEEKEYLNEYHKKVYNSIRAYLDEDERAWLREMTRGIPY